MTDRVRRALTLLAAVLALAGLAAGYVRWQLADADAFADRGVQALRSDEVRAVIAEGVVIELLERQDPDLVATRPLVRVAVEAILETDAFARVLRRAAITAHEALLDGDRDVIVELRAARAVLLPALQSASPALARRIPADISPQIAQIRSSDAATTTVRLVESISAAALPLLLGALAVLVLAVAAAPDRRREAATAGLTLVGVAAVGLAGLVALRTQVVSHADQIGGVPPDDARAAARATWDAMAGDLQGWLLITGGAGVAAWGAARMAEAGIDRRAALGLAAEIVAGGSLPTAARLARGVLVAGVGVAVLLQGDPLFEIVVYSLGAGLLVLGLAELLSLAGTSRRERRPWEPRARRRAAVAAAAAGLAGAGIALAVVLGDGAPAPLEEEEITACNGMAELCDRRLDEVVLAGTHNSMSAADRPGWYFANQTRPIPRQLDDGIRLLMLDPHYGVRDAVGRVRTDLRAEGTSRNRVAERLGADAARAAEQLAGRLGFPPADGETELYLCHTLCELGAEPMDDTLGEIRGWLERNRSEVLVVLLESSVDADDVERAFEEAELDPYLAVLPRDRPLPTLREMISAGRRLVVLGEGDAGAQPWFQPAYLFLQTTSIKTFTRSPTSCAPGAGTPGSPLLMNHWIDRFPPPSDGVVKTNGRRTLERRVDGCRRRLGRTPTMIAVDFYHRGDLLSVVRDMNAGGSAAR